MKFLSDDGGETYNRCHCVYSGLLYQIIIRRRADSSTIFALVWSNFEIGDLRFWRSEAYMKFFEHLDEAGGFYYERWVSETCISCVRSRGLTRFIQSD